MVVDGEEYDDLPDMVVGTTYLSPTIAKPRSPSTASSVSEMEDPQSSLGKAKSGNVILEMEFAHANRPAQWQRKGKGWTLEGLE